MFERVMIANRGEIAVRIIRACREMGLHTVAVHSTADEDSLHVELADEALCIGPPAASESYLKVANIISAAEVADVDAIHPGYGFLAENAHFAEVCENCRITFIGPSPESIRNMGDKATARATMKAAGVPVTPGSEGLVNDQQEAMRVARDLGYPVLIKASAGGGGKGMRIAHNDVSMANAFRTCTAEADKAFGNPALYVEKYIEKARHVEVQILADRHGTTIHLGERDCSIQRRHQKLIEESPCPAIDQATRDRLGAAAVRAAAAVKYYNAGTVEFLYDEASGEFYFMEMNTRIQVEHPVTEEVTGMDLVKEQLRVAAGEPLGYGQHDVPIKGHAIEMRVNAEDCRRGFTPCPGTVDWVHFPGGHGVRVESHVYSGYVVSPYYDSMIAKIITRGSDRAEAIARMRGALHEFRLEGVETTASLGHAVMATNWFGRGEYDTQTLPRFLEDSFVGEQRERRGE